MCYFIESINKRKKLNSLEVNRNTMSLMSCSIFVIETHARMRVLFDEENVISKKILNLSI